MDLDFFVELLDKSAVAALAIFAILQLRQAYKERAEEKSKDYKERAEDKNKDLETLAGVVERNTDAWIENTTASVKMAGAVSTSAEAAARALEGVNRIEVAIAAVLGIKQETPKGG